MANYGCTNGFADATVPFFRNHATSLSFVLILRVERQDSETRARGTRVLLVHTVKNDSPCVSEKSNIKQTSSWRVKKREAAAIGS
jgi:hypothetical protein